MTKTDLLKNLGNNIRILRLSRKMTLHNLAQILGCSTGYLGLVERGERGAKLETIVKIARYFSVSLDDLVLGELLNQKKSLMLEKQNKAIGIIKNLTSKQLDFLLTVLQDIQSFSGVK